MEQIAAPTQALEKTNYVSVETYRRSGDGVRTPVWFVESGGLVFIFTRADSGKVKRLRHNADVRLAPCRMNGDVTGEWFAATGSFVESPETVRTLQSMFEQKYGITLKVISAMSRLQKHKRIFIKFIPQE